jgi:hypothetical protein
VLRPIRIPAVLQNIVGIFSDGLEVSVGIGWVWGFGGVAEGHVGKEQYGKYEPMCTLLFHILTSQIPSQSVRKRKIKRGLLVCIISREVNPSKCDESAHRQSYQLFTGACKG